MNGRCLLLGGPRKICHNTLKFLLGMKS